MKKAIKITMVVTETYIPEPDNYEEGSTLEEMAEVDVANYKDDPSLLCDSDFASCEITAEIVEVPEDYESVH